MATTTTLYGLTAAEFEAARVRYLAHGDGPLASNIDEAGAHIRVRADSTSPDIQLHFEPVFVSSYYDGTPPDRHGFLIFTNVERPKSRGELTLNSGDPLDRPLIDPAYLSDEATST